MIDSQTQMPGIGIRNLVSRGTEYAVNFIDQFIKSSTNIKNSIKVYEYDAEHTSDEQDFITRRDMMIALIRDTYVCNLLLGYSGMMRLISEDERYEQIDTTLLKYVDEFYNDNEFKTTLYRIYSRYRESQEKVDVESFQNHQEELEIIRFLERIIDRLQIDGKKASINSCMFTLENKIYNLMNVTPLIPLDSRYLLFDGGDRIEVTGQKTKKNGDRIVEVPLHYDNYVLLVNNIRSVEARHSIELRYRSRTESTLKDFADLIIYRKLFAAEMGYTSFFKYVTRDKKDNSDAIKKLIISLNSKIEEQSRAELLSVYDYFNRRPDKHSKKITSGDIDCYNRVHSSHHTYDKYVVMYYLFRVVKQYFNISIQRHDFEEEEPNFTFKSFKLVVNDEVFGRLYIDIDRSEDKKIIDPISIKVSDRMMISDSMYTTPEVVLLANYDDKITYQQVVNLFKEFGYVLQELCYRSGVGLVNRDPEFSNFMPILMENIAWDRETVHMISQDIDVTNHIISARYFDICTRLKQKCVYAKFDHLLHNSDDVVNLLVQIIQNPEKKSDEEINQSIQKTVVELYQTIYRESFAGMTDIFDMPEDMALASIDPLAVVLEINGSQGLLYSNLMNEIFAYSCYDILKNQLKTPDEFRQLILEDGVSPFKDLISEFMRVPQVPELNSFHLYLTGLLGLPGEKHENTSHNSYTALSGMSITPHPEHTDAPCSETDNAYDYINTDYDSHYNHFDDKPMMTEVTEEDRGSIIRANRV